MASILQGTTPSLEIVISENDFIVTDVTELELTFQNGKTVLKKSLADVTVDAENNSFVYTFNFLNA